jgi:hypothetical protein
MSRRNIAIAVVIGMASTLLVGATQSALAATPVATAITTNTTWTTAGSPYVLTSDVTVTLDSTLTINPGVTVRAAPGARLFVAGTLHAVGTSQSPIVFRRDGTGSWGGIVLVGEANTTPDTTTNIQEATIEFADVGIYSRYDAPTIGNSSFTNNGTALQIIGPSGTPLTIADNLFAGNGTALTGRAAGTINVLRNDFWDNQVNIVAGPKQVYDCPDTEGAWEIHNNDILRGPQNSDYWSFDVRAEASFTVDATDNWWGTTDEERIEARLRPQQICCPNQGPGPIEWKPFSAAANTTWEPAGEVPDPAPTFVVIADPGYLVTIDTPEDGDCISRESFSQIAGGASNFLAPDPPDRVRVALRRESTGGLCQWWAARRNRFVEGYCGSRRWFKASGATGWSYGFLHLLPAGRYKAYAVAGGDRGDSSTATVRFRLLQAGPTSV